MATLPDASIDLICCDLPYAMTACTWDSIIPFDKLWEQYKRLTKPNAAIVLTASQPFTSALVMSNPKMFRCEWIWDKCRGSNFANARKQPMKSHESVLVFYAKQPTYNPQWWYSTPYTVKPHARLKQIEGLSGGSAATFHPGTDHSDGRRYPLSIIRQKRDSGRKHPTQKPVALMEYLIRTYSNEGDTVLDNCCGSGSTGVAAVASGRNFIGIEMDEKYVAIAQERLNQELICVGE